LPCSQARVLQPSRPQRARRQSGISLAACPFRIATPPAFWHERLDSISRKLSFTAAVGLAIPGVVLRAIGSIRPEHVPSGRSARLSTGPSAKYTACRTRSLRSPQRTGLSADTRATAASNAPRNQARRSRVSSMASAIPRSIWSSRPVDRVTSTSKRAGVVTRTPSTDVISASGSGADVKWNFSGAGGRRDRRDREA